MVRSHLAGRSVCCTITRDLVRGPTEVVSEGVELILKGRFSSANILQQVQVREAKRSLHWSCRRLGEEHTWNRQKTKHGFGLARFVAFVMGAHIVLQHLLGSFDECPLVVTRNLAVERLMSCKQFG